MKRKRKNKKPEKIIFIVRKVPSGFLPAYYYK
jgi:hypothetical protein